MSETEETALNNSSNEPTMQDFMKLFFSQFSQATKSLNPSDSRTVGKDEISFQLTAYDPDDTSYSIEEWLKDVNNIRTKIKIDDDIMILKAGAALQGKARKFYNGWRPLVRTWATFEDDLITAFPDHETWHTKLVRAANMKSSDFDSISEYAIEKIRSLYRFYSDLPWDRILSPVVGGIESSAVRAAINLHQPKNQKELMLLLRQNELEEPSSKRPRVDQIHHFSGKCFACNKTGHKKYQCKNVSSSIVKPIAGNESSQEKSTLVTPRGESSSYCTFCKRVGHTIRTCFKKNSQSTIRCILTERREIMPTATFAMCSLKHSFKYMVDSGADRSIIHDRVAKITNTHVTPVSHILTGFGKGSIRALGHCQLNVSLQKATLEIDFLVVPDHTIPDVDALIGWETISRHGNKIVTQKYGIDLQLCKPEPAGVRTVQVHPDLSGVDEQHRGRLQNLLAPLRSTSQNSVTTGKSQIKLTDVVPVKNKTAAQTVKVPSTVFTRIGTLRDFTGAC
jgi:hypothetical protein